MHEWKAIQKEEDKHIIYGNDITANLVACSHMLHGDNHHCTTEKPACQPLACQPACFEVYFRIPYSSHYTVQITTRITTIQQNQPTLSAFIPAPISLLAIASPILVSQSMDMELMDYGKDSQYTCSGFGMTRTSFFFFFVGNC